MEKSVSEIINAYFEALSAGDEEQLSQFLWDDFKEINPQLETIGKRPYLQLLSDRRGSEQNGRHTILELQAVGNVVSVKHKTNNHSSSAPAQHSVFALVDNKIKLEARI
ncbi:nuclear transport factor 2 family protein [Chloroflexota bacterium]